MTLGQAQNISRRRRGGTKKTGRKEGKTKGETTRTKTSWGDGCSTRWRRQHPEMNLAPLVPGLGLGSHHQRCSHLSWVFFFSRRLQGVQTLGPSTHLQRGSGGRWKEESPIRSHLHHPVAFSLLLTEGRGEESWLFFSVHRLIAVSRSCTKGGEQSRVERGRSVILHTIGFISKAGS